MKIFCHVNKKPAVIVGYGPGRKGRPRAIIISEGILRDVALKEIELDSMEKSIPQNVEPMRTRKQA